MPPARSIVEFYDIKRKQQVKHIAEYEEMKREYVCKDIINKCKKQANTMDHRFNWDFNSCSNNEKFITVKLFEKFYYEYYF